MLKMGRNEFSKQCTLGTLGLFKTVYVLGWMREQKRKLIEAEGVRDAHLKLSEGLTPEVLHYKAIEALHELASSPNAKLVITNGQNPLNLDLVYPPSLEGSTPKSSKDQRGSAKVSAQRSKP